MAGNNYTNAAGGFFLVWDVVASLVFSFGTRLFYDMDKALVTYFVF